MSVKEKMTAIADNIRDKTEKTEKLNLDNIASGINEVYEAGVKSEYDRFWDSYQSYGNQRYYKNSFSGRCWNNATFKPKYDIIATTAVSMFQECCITDLIGCLEKQNVRLDFSGVDYGFSNTFYGVSFPTIPQIDARKAKDGFSGTFRSSYIVTIQKIILNEQGTQYFGSAFDTATKLQNITFEGAIGQNISFSACPLTVESMKSIITHLKNYAESESEGKYTLTLKDECKTRLQEDMERVEIDGEVYTYFELIAVKGWNLA